LILNRENLYYDKAFNMACRLARSEWICNSGCVDLSIPDGWLQAMCEVIDADNKIDGVSIYSSDPMKAPERIRAQTPVHLNGHRIIPAVLFEVFIFRRSLLNTIGYYREDMSLHGWDDVEYIGRTDRIHAYTVTLLDWRIERNLHKLKPLPGYDEWKGRQINDQQTRSKLALIRAEGHPKYDPWNGI
jgi:hypothetical protein